MNLDDLKGAWQAQPEAAAAFGGGEMKTLFHRLERLDGDIQRRDVREYLAACFVMGIFGWMAATTGDLLVRTGALLVVFGSMFIIFWSRWSTVPRRREAARGELPMAQFCARELDRVEAQIRLLRSVWWWYLGPTIAGVLLILVPRAQSGWLMLLTVAIVAGVAAAIHGMNAAAAKYELEPLRDELAATLRELRQ